MFSTRTITILLETGLNFSLHISGLCWVMHVLHFRLRISNTGITPDTLMRVMRNLFTNKNLKDLYIDVSRNAIGVKGAQQLSPIVKLGTSVHGNCLSSIISSHLCESYSSPPSLHSLAHLFLHCFALFYPLTWAFHLW